MRSAAPTETPEPIRTLVVDDSPLIRRTVELRLRKQGHDVQTAQDGEEAFALCMKNPYDLVVTDVTMGAISGVHLCRMLRAEPTTSNIPIVLLTADDDPRSRFWGRNAGADAYIPKDQMQKGLLPVVHNLLSTTERKTSPPPVSSRDVDPLSRMSRVLDSHLFGAVVASEAQRLMDHIGDRRVFMEHATDLMSEVLGSAYAILELPSSSGETSYGVVARGPWPENATTNDFIAAELPAIDPEEVVLRRYLDERHGKHLFGGERWTAPVVAAGETLGWLHLYGGRRTVGSEDRQTASVLTNSIGAVVKSMMLLETTLRLATIDPLTQLVNRRVATEKLVEDVIRSRRYGGPLTVILCDIDHFKSVNDNFGHNMGDEVLRSVAVALQKSVRKIDVVARWGGEEFLIVLPRTDTAGARIPAERIRAAVEAIPPFQDGPQRVTTSVGVATWAEGLSADGLVDLADKSLYQAKESGRNRVVISDSGQGRRTE